MLRMVVALTAGSEMDLIAESAAKWQSYTSAVHTVPENLEYHFFPVAFDLAFCDLEWHYLLLNYFVHQSCLRLSRLLSTISMWRLLILLWS